MRRSVMVIWTALMAVLLTACSGGGKPAGGSGDTGAGSAQPGPQAGGSGLKAAPDALTVVIGAEPKSMNVLLADNGPMFQVMYGNVVEGLTILNPATGKVEPLLATKWEMTKENRWRFTLRQGVKFSNGEPFNADAVVANLKYFRDPANKTELDFYVKTIVKAEKVDDYTVDMITDVPDPIVPKRMYYLMMVAPGTLSGAKWADKPVGTGPYLFKEWRRGQSIVMSRNDSYWGEKPSVKDVTWTWRKDASVRLSMLESGEAQIVKDIPVDLLGKAPKVLAVAGNETAMLRLNARRAPTNDIRVRKAIQMAMDRKSILDALWQGYAVPANGQPTPETSFGYNPNLKDYPYDLAQAKALIKEAGATGATVDIVAPAGRYAKAEETVEIIAAALREIGLKVDVKIVDFNNWLDTLYINKASGPSAFYVATDNALFDADVPMVGYIHSKATKAMPPEDPETDRLIDAARQNLNLQEREQQYQEIFKRVHERADIVTLYRSQFIWGAQKNVNFDVRSDDWLLLKTVKIQ